MQPKKCQVTNVHWQKWGTYSTINIIKQPHMITNKKILYLK